MPMGSAVTSDFSAFRTRVVDVTMSILRMMRRRSFLLKTIVLIVIIFAIVNLTSSDHPKAVILQPLHTGRRVVDVEFPSGNDAKAGRPQAEPHGKMLQHIRDRTKEFYENVIVHFDLKGAPPRLDYFKDLLSLVAKAGATGVLLEWEDMFPYTGILEEVKNTDAYSPDDVKEILQYAHSLRLDVIPLVQTFGHLEWILKLETFRKYRENDAYPQVLCLGYKEGADVVHEAIRQVMEAHAEIGIPFFHIGADEAFEFGNCKESLDWIKSHRSTKEELALTHMKETALAVKQHSPDTVVLAWNDMLKSFPATTISKLSLGDLIEPVVWDYSETIQTQNEMTWASLAQSFSTVWASSAFKGANFPSAQYSDIRHYETNNRAWIQVKKAQESKFKRWRGIIITGWQRYDHMAALCEILPIGTPSMILNVETALNAHDPNQVAIRKQAANKLNCTEFNVSGLGLISNRCHFPGWGVYMALQMGTRSAIEYVERELTTNHQILGWLSPYTRRHDYSQIWYLNQIEPTLMNMEAQLARSIEVLKSAMQPLFFENTIDEVIYLSVGQTKAKVAGMLADLRRLKQLRTWTKRHFPIKPPQPEL